MERVHLYLFTTRGQAAPSRPCGSWSLRDLNEVLKETDSLETVFTRLRMLKQHLKLVLKEVPEILEGFPEFRRRFKCLLVSPQRFLFHLNED